MIVKIMTRFVATTLTLYGVATSSPIPLTLSALDLHTMHTETSAKNLNRKLVNTVFRRAHLKCILDDTNPEPSTEKLETAD